MQNRLLFKAPIILAAIAAFHSCTKENTEISSPPPPPDTQWKQVSSPTSEDLNDIWGTNDNCIFAVGNNGTIIRFDGSAWDTTTNAVWNNFQAVWSQYSNSVFAIGSSNANAAYYNGTEWALQELGFLRSIWGLYSGIIYVVGNNGTVKSFNGTTWNNIAAPAFRDLYGVWGNAENNVYMVGDLGLIFKYSGTAWSPMSSGVSQCIMPADAATAAYYDISERWEILRDRCYVHGSQPMSYFLFEHDIRELSSVGPATIKSAEIDIEYHRLPEHGLSKNLPLYYYLDTADGIIKVEDAFSGTLFSEVPCNSAMSGKVHIDVLDVLRDALNESKDYIGFRIEASDYYGLDFPSCSPSMIITLVSSPFDLRSVWGSSSDNVYAVGTSGTILHYDGQGWTKMDSGTFYDLNDIWGSSAKNIFAVGNAGRILHFDGTSWTPMTSPMKKNLYGVWGGSSWNIYAVGEDGLILRCIL